MLKKTANKMIKKGKLYFAKTSKGSMDIERVIGAKNSLSKPTSVLFFTSHKCASSFVDNCLDLVLKNSQYRLINYASAIWRLGNSINIKNENEDPLGNNESLKLFLEQASDSLFFQKGEIYAPLRVPVDFPTRSGFKHIFFLRDPRDVLVSAYYSRVYSHKLPINNTSKKKYQEKRRLTLEKGIDQHAVEAAQKWLIPLYGQYKEFLESSDSYLYITYDDFKNDPKQFVQTIMNFLNVQISKSELNYLSKQASPVQKEVDINKHKRSGKSQQYLKELKPETIDSLNHILDKHLDYWGFKN